MWFLFMPKKMKREVKNVKPIMHIFCEGEKTEPNYLNKFIEDVSPGDRRKQTVVVEPTSKNTPVQLVDEAIKLKKNSPKGDEFWVVYDRECISKYSDSLHAKAYHKAVSNCINVVVNNVCFELWLLLHFGCSSAQYASYVDLINSSNLKSKMKEVGIPEYDKGDALVYGKVKPLLLNAINNSIRVNKMVRKASPGCQQFPYQLNPYTDMPLLLQAIELFK